MMPRRMHATTLVSSFLRKKQNPVYCFSNRRMTETGVMHPLLLTGLTGYVSKAIQIMTSEMLAGG